jgi:hypothetical protein
VFVCCSRLFVVHGRGNKIDHRRFLYVMLSVLPAANIVSAGKTP